jgi:hypothetical protein
MATKNQIDLTARKSSDLRLHLGRDLGLGPESSDSAGGGEKEGQRLCTIAQGQGGRCNAVVRVPPQRSRGGLISAAAPPT